MLRKPRTSFRLLRPSCSAYLLRSRSQDAYARVATIVPLSTLGYRCTAISTHARVSTMATPYRALTSTQPYALPVSALWLALMQTLALLAVTSVYACHAANTPTGPAMTREQVSCVLNELAGADVMNPDDGGGMLPDPYTVTHGCGMTDVYAGEVWDMIASYGSGWQRRARLERHPSERPAKAP